MDLNKLTIKSQEALARSQQAAAEHNHQQVEPAHVLAALLAEPEGVVYPLLQKLGASPRTLMNRVTEALERVPKVYGQVEAYLSVATRSMLEQAFVEADNLGDSYVSTEHLLLALLEQRDEVAALLSEAGVDRGAVL